MSDPLVTAVLLNWRRPDNIRPIVESLHDQPFVDDVVIWDNAEWDDERERSWLMPRTTVVRTGRNIGCLGRFVAAGYHAFHEWVITQDDDVLIHNWGEIYKQALAHTDVITGNMHLNEDASHGGLIYVDGTCWDIWLGYGSMFRRDLIGDLFGRYASRWGEDDVLRRDADRVFATSLGRRHHAIQAHMTNLPGIDGPMAIHKDGRTYMTKLARERAVELFKEGQR